MRKLLLILYLIAFVLKAQSQSLCPNLFKCGDTLIDPRDSFRYPTVQIGTQCWFQVNLHATKYLNGNTITFVSNPALTWSSMTTGAYCDYNNSAAEGVIYGHLYNWNTVNDTRGLCPQGWYVPSFNEWNILYAYLGGWPACSPAMKVTGTAYCTSTPPATNSSGFSALPSGYWDGTYTQFRWLDITYAWWGSTFQGDYGTQAGLQCTDSNGGGVGIYSYLKPSFGFTVRCLKEY